MNAPLARVEGSFRDPAGQVFEFEERIFRVVRPLGAAEYEAARPSLRALVADGRLIAFEEVEPPTPIASTLGAVAYVLEHPRFWPITLPYEWSFSMLKEAALFHLKLHLDLLERGFTLADATAYNVQFRGTSPVFIDHLSVRRYREGEFWTGHKQFCEQFLNPLLLRSYLDVAHNSWYRGNMEGIPQRDLAFILPLRSRFSWRVLSNVIIPAKLQSKFTSDKRAPASLKRRQLPLSAYKAMLRQLLAWIEGLTPRNSHKTTWAEYSRTTTYSSDEKRLKHAFVADFVARTRPRTIVDLGCNTGDYSRICLQSGAQSAVGFDFDQQALDEAFRTAKSQSLNFTPLFLNAANPSPRQGWMQAERAGFADRVRADAVLALAFEHHLAIAHNVPLDEVIGWITSIAPHGVIEFVQKSDPTIQEMLRLREDIFADYGAKAFEAALQNVAKITAQQTVSSTGRTLYAYERKT